MAKRKGECFEVGGARGARLTRAAASRDLCFLRLRAGAGLFLPRGWVRDSVLCIWFHFRSIHPFEIPEVISLPIDQGNPLYLKWIEENVPRD